ncbi:hypothetical protein AWZ03_013905 [Drosophila navojoa]|uniref:Uncharacterized protein n=1 Tax=Drosophila navojoa TaxID=7232 RepID=A0A484AUF0_DRONA|nr:hypothetical protein AWZ03_013905 [Drosophila navojoa]
MDMDMSQEGLCGILKKSKASLDLNGRFIAEQLSHPEANIDGKEKPNVTSKTSHKPPELCHQSSDAEQPGKNIVETGYEPSEKSQ